MAAPSPTDALQSVMDIADILSGLLGTFEVSSVVSKPPPQPPPQPKSKKPPPLALPRTRTLHFPENKVKMSLAITEHLRTIYTAKIKQLRRVAQEEYTHLCRSLQGADFAKIGKLLRTSYRASEDRFAQQAIDACLDAHDLAVNPPTDPTVPEVKRPFNRTMVAIFEYIFDQPSGNYINAIDKQRLADLSGMTNRQITVWFQNRRARTKRKITAGKVPEPMTLEKALVKLHADCEKARSEKVKATGTKEITFKKTEKVLIEEAEDHDEEDSDAICPRDQYEDDVRLLYATGMLPNLDVTNPSPGSFPRRFKMPTYPEPRFEAPIWPRTTRQLPSKPVVPVTKLEVQSLAKKFDDVVELQKTRTVVTRRTVTFSLPLPPAIQEAVTRRDARKVRNSKKADLVTSQPHPVDEDAPTIQALPSNVQELLKSIPKRNQVQISEPQTPDGQVMVEADPVHEPYVAPPLPPTMTALTMKLSRTDLGGEPESETSGGASDSGSSSGSTGSSSVAIPSLDMFLNPPEDLQEPLEVFMADDLVNGSRVNPTDYPPIINTEPECIPIEDILMDSDSMIEALKMTLRELQWKGPLPANIDEPFVFNYAPSMAPNPAESCLGFLDHVYRGREDEILPPTNAATMDVSGNAAFDPNTIPVPLSPPASASTPFPYFPLGQDYVSAESVDNGDLHLSEQIHDSEGISLPFALADSVVQPVSIDDTSEAPPLSNPYDWEDGPQPFALAYPTSKLLTDVDTSAELIFEQDSDPQSSALPFALMNQDVPIDGSFVGMDQISGTEHASFQAETDPFYDQQFSDSYMFFAPPPTRVQPSPEPPAPAEPPVSFYPSYLPQVPVITEEIKKAASLVHDWLDKAVGIKLKPPSFIDPEAMLQYLA